MISAISAWEVALLARKRRIALADQADLWVRRALADPRVEELPVTVQIAVRAGMVENGFHGDPVDRIIYATACRMGASLVTRDEQIRRLDPARTIW